MFAIAFDLEIAEVQIHYSKHVPQAYAEIRSLLGVHGFVWAQGSVYISQNENLANLTGVMNALKALPWFPASVRDIRAFRVEQWSDFTDFMKT